jgi:ADP-ribosylglycohydrolase
MGNNLFRDPKEVGKPTENYAPSRLKAIEELPIALAYILLNNGNLEKSIVGGVNSGRDTDSIGVMIGAITGALNGVEAIKEMHITKLKEANRYDFIEISDEFYKTVLKIQEEDEKNTKTIIQKRNKLRGLK